MWISLEKVLKKWHTLQHFHILECESSANKWQTSGHLWSTWEVWYSTLMLKVVFGSTKEVTKFGVSLTVLTFCLYFLSPLKIFWKFPWIVIFGYTSSLSTRKSSKNSPEWLLYGGLWFDSMITSILGEPFRRFLVDREGVLIYNLKNCHEGYIMVLLNEVRFFLAHLWILHGGLMCVAFCPPVCLDWTKNQTGL